MAGCLSGCGSGAASAPHAQNPEVEATCQQVRAVLANGPDPGADPVGYALAQVLPLRQLQTKDGALHGAIEDLAAAYEAFYTSNGGKAAANAVNKAGDTVDTICPEAVSVLS
jgi:hypothetical protein